jgi:small ligand-binding sensory domain FIST
VSGIGASHRCFLNDVKTPVSSSKITQVSSFHQNLSSTIMAHSTDQQKFVFASALSTRQNSAAALEEVCQSVLQQLGSTAHVALAFYSAEHLDQAGQLAEQLCEQLGTRNIIGCSGESIVGKDREVENEPALSLWAARMPGVSVLPMQLEFVRTLEGSGILGWPDDLPPEWPANSTLLVLGDPFSFPAEVLLELINDEHPGVPVIGGMASTASQPGENRLLIGNAAVSQGAVALLMHGPLKVRTLVSQGCRPIGEPFVITRAERNTVLELGGEPAYKKLVDTFQTLATREQEQVRRGLHLGRVVNEYLEHFDQGDFLVRNVLGMDVNSGAIAVGDFFRMGQTVQFHVRDWETADAELRQLLSEIRRNTHNTPRGGFLFSCNGRGSRLFPEPNHDAHSVAEVWPDMPLAGFFAAGELGPIGGRNFIHGFTASIAILEQG